MTIKSENAKAECTFKAECKRLDATVDRFARVMKAKLHQKAGEGFHGWQDRNMENVLRHKILEHAAKVFSGDLKQTTDVANLAMMLFFMQRKH